MNRILTISAITMFAVVMGLAAFAPAAMAKGPDPQNNVTLCHFDADPDDNPETEDSVWEVITPNNHAVEKHIANHGDIRIGVTDPGATPPTISEVDCLLQN